VILTAAGAAMLLGACSSRPREFAPSFASTAVDVTGAQKAAAECKELYAKGKLNSEGRLASAGMGAAAGGAMGVAGGAAATSAGLYGGGMAIASATVVLIPFAVIGGAVGMAKIKRGKKERAIQQAMAGCLRERGYQVAGWERIRK
jgi:hypothetical protein